MADDAIQQEKQAKIWAAEFMYMNIALSRRENGIYRGETYMANKTKIKTVNVMVGCPEDAEQFIPAIREGIANFNKNFEKSYKVHLECQHYKGNTHSAQGNPQDIINKQLCDRCELLIAVFYMSAGSANATGKPGTFEEIDYFGKAKKNAFVFEFTGEATITMGDRQQCAQFRELIQQLAANKDKILFAHYEDSAGLTKEVEKQLSIYYKKYYENEGKASTKSRRKQNTRAPASPEKNVLQAHMCYHMRQFDFRNRVENGFSFYDKSQDLIDGIKENGSVQYYVRKNERYRTTPTASVLEALYLGGLIPCSVCYKMQDWVYSSRTDPGDEPNKLKNGEIGHKPDDCDQYGWSWNEGVSVWATSKALSTLIRTGYYKRQDIRDNPEICKTTREALSWLAEQAYDNGGWGFQKATNLPDCAPTVTMTALTLTTITQFLNAEDNRSGIKLGDDLEKKLSEAKQKGIQYLLETKKEDAETVYWEYNGVPSLTGTVWVLDFINIGKKNEAGDLYHLRKKIKKFCLDKLPSTKDELDRYQEEVYFTGGETKYKDIPKNKKFYSYMPYHIVVLLRAGVDPDDKHITTCIKELLTGDDYWKGTDRSAGAHQRASCFVIAMALCAISEWIRVKQKPTSIVQD